MSPVLERKKRTLLEAGPRLPRENNHLHHTSRPPPHEEAWMGGSGQKVAKLIFLSVLTSVRITAPLTFPL